MPTDINQKLLAAFRVEYIEHLEGIRAGLQKLEQAGGPDGGPTLEDAFRRAHSLKGAARITGLAPIETLAHRLESLFFQVRSGVIGLDAELYRVIHRTLDAIEDAGTATAQGGAPASVAPALEELDRILEGGKKPAIAPPAPITELQRKLRAAFDLEYREYIQGLRAVVAKVQHGVTPAAAEIEEAFRCAHSLKAAARVAEVGQVDVLADRLEILFARIRQAKLKLDPQVAEVIQRSLEVIERQVTAPGQQPADDTLASLDRLLSDAQSAAGSQITKQSVEPPAAPRKVAEPSIAQRKAAESTAAAGTALAAGELASTAVHQPVETVRLSADHLDRLLQSTGRLLTESLQQEMVFRELKTMGRQVTEIEREWETVKKASTAAMRRLNTTPEFARVARYLEFVEHEIHSLSRHTRAVRTLQQQSSWSLRLVAEQLQQDVRRARMVPAESELQGFRKMMRDLARDEGKEIDFRVTGFDVQADRMVLQALKDPLMHILRNAVTHGIESGSERKSRGKNSAGQVAMRIDAVGNRLTIAVEDDGRGVDLEKVAELAVRRGLTSEADATSASPTELARFLFQPGFSTSRIVTELSGRGMGLSAVYEAVTRLQGEVEVRPRDAAGTAIVLTVPLSISTHRLLLLSSAGQTFALPLYGIEALYRIKPQEVETVEGKPMVSLAGQLTSLTSLADLLEMQDGNAFDKETLSVAVLRSGPKRVAVLVDALIMERDALIKDLGEPASQINRFMGGIVLEDGSISLVLNPVELVEGFKPSGKTSLLKKAKAAETKKAPTILVVDDSFTTRTLETSILETHGYRVRVAIDGLEALNQLRSEKVDLVITDVQMPRLDGFGLLEEIKKDPRLAKTPVIVVSSLDRREDQERGLSLGADAYIVKRKFDHQDLLSTIKQLL